MVFRNVLFLSLVMAVLVSACSQGGGAASSLDTPEDSLAYSLGIDYASNLKRVGVSGLDTEAFNKALSDVLAGNDLEVTDKEASQMVRDFAAKINAPDATEEDKKVTDKNTAYAFGVDYGKNLQQTGLEDFQTDAFASAINAAMTGGEDKKLLIAPEQAAKVIEAQFKALQAKKGEVNKVKGAEFLAKNKEREGITVTDSGLQYEVMTEGTGAIPTAEDKVSVHYHGTLIDGTVFDSSVERDQPATFPVTGVIQGWIEALQLMPTGSKWKLFIPSDLAYGERGSRGGIGPNETLIFEVELLGIEDKK